MKDAVLCQGLRKQGCATAPPQETPPCRNRICVSRVYETRERVAVITINRPESRNAISEDARAFGEKRPPVWRGR